MSEAYSVYDLAHSKGTPSPVRDAMLLMEKRIAALEAENAALREAFEVMRREATMHCQNSEACAIDHYGEDCAHQGLPRWISDSKQRIIEATDALARTTRAGHE